MNVSLFQAASAMNASARWQELISQNLSASSIPGFKKQEMSFAATQAGRVGTPGASQPAIVPTTSSAINFSPGELRATGGITDIALEGRGFFQVQMPGGNTAFTRDGEFHLSAQGQLVTKEGYTVLGENGPIQFDRKNPAPVSISPKGDVSQGTESVGKLKVVDFDNTKSLSPLSAGYFHTTNPDDLPKDVTDASIRQGFLENANTTSVMEMVNLMGAMRSFEANQRSIQMQDERIGRAISELGSSR
jgi:flagellar basal-body rod protein FlgG